MNKYKGHSRIISDNYGDNPKYTKIEEGLKLLNSKFLNPSVKLKHSNKIGNEGKYSTRKTSKKGSTKPTETKKTLKKSKSYDFFFMTTYGAQSTIKQKLNLASNSLLSSISNHPQDKTKITIKYLKKRKVNNNSVHEINQIDYSDIKQSPQTIVLKNSENNMSNFHNNLYESQQITKNKYHFKNIDVTPTITKKLNKG